LERSEAHKGKFQSVVNVIDDGYGNENISNAFADKYCELYNSVPFDKNIMAKILSKLSGKSSNETLSKKCYSLHVIQVSDVIDSLKASKADDINNLKSDTFINGCHSLFTHISLLFSALLRHRVTPNNMLWATLVPIPKKQ